MGMIASRSIVLRRRSRGSRHRHVRVRAAASTAVTGVLSKASGVLLNLEPPCRELSGPLWTVALPTGYGGKARREAATTCRFLTEAPPLGNLGRSATGHARKCTPAGAALPPTPMQSRASDATLFTRAT